MQRQWTVSIALHSSEYAQCNVQCTASCSYCECTSLLFHSWVLTAQCLVHSLTSLHCIMQMYCVSAHHVQCDLALSLYTLGTVHMVGTEFYCEQRFILDFIGALKGLKRHFQPSLLSSIKSLVWPLSQKTQCNLTMHSGYTAILQCIVDAVLFKCFSYTQAQHPLHSAQCAFLKCTVGVHTQCWQNVVFLLNAADASLKNLKLGKQSKTKLIEMWL